MITKPFHFKKWIDDHREILRPPIGNKQVFQDSTFIVMVVGGPNKRKDYHINETDEFFYQLEGKITLKIVNPSGEFEDIPIDEGEVFMLPRKTPHSPQRPANTVGMVVEKTRAPGEKDGLRWYCEGCRGVLYEEFFHLSNIETQFAGVFKRYGDSGLSKCQACGKIND